MYKEYTLFTNQSYDQQQVSIPVRGSPRLAFFKIHEITIPLAFDTTDSSNNKIVFERQGVTKTAVLPNGSYNASSFPTALAAALNAVSTVKDFVVSYDATTRRITTSAGTAFTIKPFSSGTTAYRQLGMTKYTPGGSGTSVSFGVADLTNSSPILLTSNSLVSRDLTYLGDENINVLAMVHVDSPQNSVQRWANSGSYVSAHGAELSTVDLRLLNGATMLPLDISQPYSVTFSVLTDEDDLQLYA